MNAKIPEKVLFMLCKSLEYSDIAENGLKI
jgi:hypothetical protein